MIISCTRRSYTIAGGTWLVMFQARHSRLSAGLLLFRRREGKLEVFLAHPGGPFWKNRDAGAWTIPKGLVESGEDLLATACREFQEETGIVPQGPYRTLGEVRQKAGKLVHAWAWEGDADPRQIVSNAVADSHLVLPEIDRCEWFGIDIARQKLNSAQVAFLDRLRTMIDSSAL